MTSALAHSVPDGTTQNTQPLLSVPADTEAIQTAREWCTQNRSDKDYRNASVGNIQKALGCGVPRAQRLQPLVRSSDIPTRSVPPKPRTEPIPVPVPERPRTEHSGTEQLHVPAEWVAEQNAGTVIPERSLWQKATYRNGSIPVTPERNIPSEHVPAVPEQNVPRSTKFRRMASAAGIISVAIVAAVLSYSHQKYLAGMNGQHGMLAVLWPLAVDGLLLACGIRLATDRATGLKANRWAWCGFLLGILVSVGANALATHGDWIARCISAFPAVALLITVETLTSRKITKDS